MRKIFFLFVAVLWIAAGVQLVQNLNREDEGQIVQAFNKTNCMNAMSKIQVSGSLNMEYRTIKEQREILMKIAKELGITGDYQIADKKDGAQTVVQFNKEAARAETMMKIVSVESEISDNVVETIQYLVVEIYLYDKLECAVPYKENLENVVKQYGITDNVTLQFTGDLAGRIEGRKQKEIAEQLIESISAKKKSEQEENGVYTVYAYTDIIGEAHKINGELVNVTVAINYNEEKNQTRLYLATPFLSEDY